MTVHDDHEEPPWDDDGPPPPEDTTPPFDELEHLRTLRQQRDATLDAEQAARDTLNLRVPELGAILNGDQPDEHPTWLAPPDGPALFYPGRYHDLHGLPSGGKTWVALATCAQILNQGDGGILWIDWEDTPATFVRRLQALGVPDPLIGDPTLVRYVQPQGPLHREEQTALLEHARTVDAAMVILDALAPALALDGLDENSNTDVTRWVERVVKPFLADGRAVTGLDHIPKDPDNRSIGSRGAGAKRAIIDGASYTVLTVTAFSRTRAGEIKLRIAKDRPGMVGPVGTIASHIHLTPRDNGAQLDVRISLPPVATDETGQFIPTHLMERVSRWLEAQPEGTQVSKNAVSKAVVGKAPHLRTAVDQLARAGHLATDSSGTNPVYTLVNPYRDPRDPDATRRDPGRGANPDEEVRDPATPGNYIPGSRVAPSRMPEDEDRDPDPTLDEEPW